jgi:hypothetical protein
MDRAFFDTTLLLSCVRKQRPKAFRLGILEFSPPSFFFYLFVVQRGQRRLAAACIAVFLLVFAGVLWQSFVTQFDSKEPK